MSLLICSSAQAKYSEAGFKETDDSDVLTSTASVRGIQKPSAFTNNINPVFRIPANSEVALKSASYFRNKHFQIGSNTSFSFYFGQLLRTRFGNDANLSLKETTNYPIPMPIPKGQYNMRSMANAISASFDDYISHPDLFRHCWVEPASDMGDSVYSKGFIMNLEQGDSDTLVDNHAQINDMVEWIDETDFFTFDLSTHKYTCSKSDADDSIHNLGIIQDAPLSQRGGIMEWNTESATSGWRVGLTRPTARDGREQPEHFVWDDALVPFFDYMVHYNGSTFRIYHSVVRDGTMVMREVEYWTNTDAHFTPALSHSSRTQDYSPMIEGARWTKTSGGGDYHPSKISIQVSGEDITIFYEDSNRSVYYLTDTRVFISGNANATARTPTRNKVPKPTGLNTHALYPKVNVVTQNEFINLTKYESINKDGLFLSNGKVNGYTYPEISESGVSATSGSSFWGRSQLNGGMDTGQIALNVDFSDCYNSSLTTAQKQYVGLAGPTGEDPAVREGEGDPAIPSTATETGLAVAYAMGLVLVPSSSDVSNNTIKGVYACNTSDVTDLLGFPDRTLVVSQRGMGYDYLLTDAPTEESTDPPTNTVGAFHGFYVGSDDAPVYLTGSLFVRIPQFTHQSFNFGKGIPSKIIAQLPSGQDNEEGQIYYEPANLTYLSLNNPNPLDINVLTCEIVDKTEEVISETVLGRSTTIQLHIRQQQR